MTRPLRRYIVIPVRELSLRVDTSGGRRAGLERALREAIRSGRLPPGASLPSTRALAADLVFARSTVVAAYEQLVAEGYLVSRQGVGTVVADVGRTTTVSAPSPKPSQERFTADFRPGEPDPSSFPRRLWLGSLRHVMATVTDDVFGYPDPRGRYELRTALADYLARSRAVSVTPDAISTFAGYAAAIGFLGETFASVGITDVAIEDPTFFLNREILRLTGVTPVPIPLDGDGIDTEALDRSGARAVVVTPGHQYPLGVTMSPERRSSLIEWANRSGSWIVEDDYDGEFRYDRQPIGALQGLDPDRVIYAGTASKSLGPGLRMGWLVMPPALRDRLAMVKHMRGATSTLDQLTLGDFIERGNLDRHLRTVRAAYRKRQMRLVTRLESEVPSLHVPQRQAGLHLTCHLPEGCDEARLIDEAAIARIGLMGLGSHWMGKPTSRGLVLGYSRPPEHHFDSALDQLIDFLGPQIM